MSLADQFQSLQQQGSAFRNEIFGATAAMDDVPNATFACYYSPATETEMLMPFGIKSDFDLVLRVPKTETNFVPEIGRNVKILGLGQGLNLVLFGTPIVARLVKPRTHAAGVEHVFECKSQS
jgi:hypothetical protein